MQSKYMLLLQLLFTLNTISGDQNVTIQRIPIYKEPNFSFYYSIDNFTNIEDPMNGTYCEQMNAMCENENNCTTCACRNFDTFVSYSAGCLNFTRAEAILSQGLLSFHYTEQQYIVPTILTNISQSSAFELVLPETQYVTLSDAMGSLSRFSSLKRYCTAKNITTVGINGNKELTWCNFGEEKIDIFTENDGKFKLKWKISSDDLENIIGKLLFLNIDCMHYGSASQRYFIFKVAGNEIAPLKPPTQAPAICKRPTTSPINTPNTRSSTTTSTTSSSTNIRTTTTNLTTLVTKRATPVSGGSTKIPITPVIGSTTKKLTTPLKSTSPPKQDAKNDEDDDNQTAIIVGAVLGIVFFIVVVIIVLMLMKRKQLKKAPHGSVSMQPLGTNIETEPKEEGNFKSRDKNRSSTWDNTYEYSAVVFNQNASKEDKRKYEIVDEKMQQALSLNQYQSVNDPVNPTSQHLYEATEEKSAQKEFHNQIYAMPDNVKVGPQQNPLYECQETETPKYPSTYEEVENSLRQSKGSVSPNVPQKSSDNGANSNDSCVINNIYAETTPNGYEAFGNSSKDKSQDNLYYESQNGSRNQDDVEDGIYHEAGDPNLDINPIYG